MNITDLLVVGAAIILGFIILKFVVKIFFKFIIFLLIAAFAVFVLFFWKGGLLDVGNKDFMLKELHNKYCQTSSDDRIKCECILDPLMSDIYTKYSPEEINKISKDKIESLRIISKSVAKNKSQIMKCLKENNADSLWYSFLSELKNFDFENKLDKTIDFIKEKQADK